jgi:hypothetical protein
MPLAAQVRRAGIAFEAQTRALPEALPRMDVAAFVGLATTGPLDTPVAVEDPAQLEAVFGPDVPLGWDARAGAVATAHLGPAVRAFFRNGGKRCWVVRVAGPGARAARVRVPGLVGFGAGRVWQAVARARSVGSWWDGLSLAARIAVRPAPVAAGSWMRLDPIGAGPDRGRVTARLSLSAASPARLAPGDLLRIRLPRERVGPAGAIAYVPVAAVSEASARGGTASGPGGEAAGVEVSAADALWLEIGTAGTLPADRWRLWTAGKPGCVPAYVHEPERAREDGRIAILAKLGGAAAPIAGSAVSLEREGLRALLVVEASSAWSVPDVPFDARLVGRLLRPTPPPPTVDLEGAVCELLELELRARRGDRVAHLAGLGFAQAHARCWASLPDDEALAGEVPLGRAELFAAARAPRFPVAGDGRRRASGAFYAPVGLDLDWTGWETALESTRPARVRDGLDPLDVRCFLDPELAEVGADALLAAAEHIAWQQPSPRRLRGIHSVAWNDEVTLVAAPDAAQPGWDRVAGPSEIAQAPGESAPPARGAFSSCAPSGAARARTTAAAEPNPSERWVLRAEAAPGPLLSVQRALLRLAAARGDWLAVLSAPRGSRDEDALLHAARLRSTAPDPAAGALPGAPRISPLSGTELRAASHGALYHPWLHEVEDDGVTALRPPVGAVAGMLARRARERGAWSAPANEALRGIVALDAGAAAARADELAAAQVNAVRGEARGFLSLSEATLSRDPELAAIHVRRLLSLLRRTALRQGAGYVFEPRSAAFRRMVERGFGELLAGMFERGAFAGPTPETSFQVSAAPLDGAEGAFFVELRVAPATPTRFLRIRLVQSGERGLVTEGR